MACAPRLYEGCVEDGVHLLDLVPAEERGDLLVYDLPELLCSEQRGEAAEDRSGVAILAVVYEAEPPEPLVDVQRPRELPEALHLLHAHHYEGS
jgi:hypothetical protein